MTTIITAAEETRVHPDVNLGGASHGTPGPVCTLLWLLVDQ